MFWFETKIIKNNVFMLFYVNSKKDTYFNKNNLLTKAVFTEHVIDNLKLWINSMESLYEKHKRVSSLFNQAFIMVAELQSNGLIVTTFTRCNFVLVTSNVLKLIRGSSQF